MPDSFAYIDDTISPDAAHSKAAAPSRMDKILKRVLLVLGVILGIELVWMFGITPCLPLAKVEVSGIPGIEKEFIVNRAGITGDTSFLTANTARMEKALAGLSMVESAEITRQFPDTLRIVLKPRVPVAISLANIDGKIVPLFIDKQGVVCRIGTPDPESRVMASTLPIISGLVFENAVLGTRLPVLFSGMLENIDQIARKNPVLLSSISEIRVQKKLYDGFELVLYPAHSNIKVRTGAVLNEEMLKYMMLVIDVLETKGVQVDEIDFRTGTASYKVKEAHSG